MPSAYVIAVGEHMWKAHLQRAVTMARRTTCHIKMAHIRHILYLSFITSSSQPISALSHAYLSPISQLSHTYLTPISALSPLYRSFISALSHAHLRSIARSSQSYRPAYLRSCAPLWRAPAPKAERYKHGHPGQRNVYNLVRLKLLI